MNRLSQEKSPYLLQHASNPVDWFPWGEAAFEKARREDKPVFLSIGYSACHWCHVMREESFENPAIAAQINASYVPIKVDREERPDIDHVYMQAALLLLGGAGWPLTVFLTPEKLPFYAGTYFPPHSRYGMPGIDEVLHRITELWTKDRRLLLSSAETVITAIRSEGATTTPRDPEPDLVTRAYPEFLRQFDREYKGFGGPPKFPPPLQCLQLLRHWYRTKEGRALTMVTETLHTMRRGGVYDQVGCGFHRYATDRAWLIPHFEKMLTDQALCALAYTEAFQATGEDAFRLTAREVLAYVLRDLSAPAGGFYTAEDAESEGSEGKYYLWTWDAVAAALGAEGAQEASGFLSLSREGNFPEPGSGINVLALLRPYPALSEEEKTRYHKVRRNLFAARAKRNRPARDDKILTDTNGLAIAALARAGRVFGAADLTSAAVSAARFVVQTMRREGRLQHRFFRDEAGITARCNDYAFLIWGLIELYETTFQAEWLAVAANLQRECISCLGSPEGGFFLAPRDQNDLIHNPREVRDGAVPSGNGISYQNLISLYRLTGNSLFAEEGLRLARAFAAQVADSP
ncbi:MAG: thioredoxin domain-containing protein, partial [Methanomicrobiales archaeon]|nr:thioredoxin domain-containing protein [Methanomicrobiales archaeon]